MAGPYKQDLGFLLGALGAGLDPMSGIQMLQQAQADRETRQAQRDELVQSLVGNVQGLAQTDPEGFTQQEAYSTIESAAPGRLGERAISQLETGGVFPGERPGSRSVYYENPNAPGYVPDQEDVAAMQAQVQTQVERLQETAGPDWNRADARLFITDNLRQQLGPDLYEAMRPQIHSAIDSYWGVGGMSDEELRANILGEEPSPAAPAEAAGGFEGPSFEDIGDWAPELGRDLRSTIGGWFS